MRAQPFNQRLERWSRAVVAIAGFEVWHCLGLNHEITLRLGLETAEQSNQLRIKRDIAQRTLALAGEIFCHPRAEYSPVKIKSRPFNLIDFAPAQTGECSQAKYFEALATFGNVELAAGVGDQSFD